MYNPTQMFNQHQAVPQNMSQMQFQAFIPGYPPGGMQLPYPGAMPSGINQPRFYDFNNLRF